MDNIYRGAYSQTFTGLLSDTCAPLPPQCHVKVFFSEAGGVITKKKKEKKRGNSLSPSTVEKKILFLNKTD